MFTINNNEKTVNILVGERSLKRWWARKKNAWRYSSKIYRNNDIQKYMRSVQIYRITYVI